MHAPQQQTMGGPSSAYIVIGMSTEGPEGGSYFPRPFSLFFLSFSGSYPVGSPSGIGGWAGHNSSLDWHWCEHSSRLFFSTKRRSRDGVPVDKNPKARRGAVHRVSWSFNCFFFFFSFKSFLLSCWVPVSCPVHLGWPAGSFQTLATITLSRKTSHHNLCLDSSFWRLLGGALSESNAIPDGGGGQLTVTMYFCTSQSNQCAQFSPPIRLTRVRAAVCDDPVKPMPKSMLQWDMRWNRSQS
jgi:hypothetical protein